MKFPEQRRNFLLSTDQMGVLPDSIFHILDRMKLEDFQAFSGLEIVAFRPLQKVASLVSESRKRGMATTGLHGRAGGAWESEVLADQIKLAFLNRWLLPWSAVSQMKDVDYVLLHEPEGRRLLNEGVHFNGGFPPVFIENHVGPGAGERAALLAKTLFEQDLSVGFMFDVSHHMRSEPFSSIEQAWHESLFFLSETISKADDGGCSMPVGIHLAMGTDPLDSLPRDSISPAMWRQLGAVLKERKDIFIVLEHQHKKLLRNIRLTGESAFEEQVKLIEDNLGVLFAAGLL